MFQHTRPRALAIAFGGILPALVLGCSGNTTSSTTTSNSSSSSPDFTGASTSTASEVTASVGSMSLTQTAASGGAMAEVQPDRALYADTAGAAKGCGTVVINSTGSTGAVTDETITYALPACAFTGVRGLSSLAITGTLELTMPDATGFDFTSKATSLEYAFTTPSGSGSETRNGTRQVTATAASAALVNAMTTQFTKNGTGTGTFINTLSLSFAPVSGSSLAIGQPLPDGTLQANGTVSWTPATAGSSVENFTVSTVTPLAYDAACATTSASPFDSGELRVVITDGSVKSYGQITWSSCGAPTVVVL